MTAGSGSDLICVTIDTDPDGVTGQVMNRTDFHWKGLEQIHSLLDQLNALQPELGAVPVTWFIRADGQLRDVLGSSAYLLEKFDGLWREARHAGHEIGWHPHLYRAMPGSRAVSLMSDPQEAADEIENLWSTLASQFPAATCFRNGEGWHHPATLDTVERLGFTVDSTAIPGRVGASGHPMNWRETPNRPYFPDCHDIRRQGSKRALLEIPMNSWLVQAAYDTQPRLRYINPAFREDLFQSALERWIVSIDDAPAIWTLILHPDEAMAVADSDLLYARSPVAVANNLRAFAHALAARNRRAEFTTLPEAARRWRQQERAS